MYDTGEEFDINDYWLHDGDDRDGWFTVGRVSHLPPHMCCSKCEYYAVHSTKTDKHLHPIYRMDADSHYNDKGGSNDFVVGQQEDFHTQIENKCIKIIIQLVLECDKNRAFNYVYKKAL